MIKHIKCDIFESGADIICHQVNCQGVMGSGIAKQVRDKYPKVYEEYKEWCDDFSPDFLIGTVQYVGIYDNNLTGIINVFGQINYGYDGKCYTDYDALKKAFNNIHRTITKTNFFSFKPIIAFPYKFGCARGGGDWNIVYKMIKEIFEEDIDVLICEYNGG